MSALGAVASAVGSVVGLGSSLFGRKKRSSKPRRTAAPKVQSSPLDKDGPKSLVSTTSQGLLNQEASTGRSKLLGN